MLVQIQHREEASNELLFFSQREFEEIPGEVWDDWQKVAVWCAEVGAAHPLPSEAVWRCCREGDPQFVVTVIGHYMP